MYQHRIKLISILSFIYLDNCPFDFEIDYET